VLRYLCNILLYLALAVVIGGTVFFGAIVAPTLFSGGVLSGRTVPGALNSILIDRLSVMLVVCSAVIAGCALYTASHYRRWVNWVAFGLAVAMLAGSAWTSAQTIPKMNALRVAIGNFDVVPTEKQKLLEEFQERHQRSSMIVQGIVIAAVLVLVLHTITIVSAAQWHRKMGGALGTLQKEIVTASEQPTVREQLIEAVEPVREMIEERRREHREEKEEERRNSEHEADARPSASKRDGEETAA